MSERSTLSRSIHDVSLAAWFGGSLMGVIGLNGGASTAKSPVERLTISSAGWAKWSPVQLAAMVAHAGASVAQLASNGGRLLEQPGARRNAVIKTGLTLVAAGASLYSGVLGSKQAKHAEEGAAATTTPSASASAELKSAQRQQKIMQWVTPAVTLVLIVLAAQQGEQQRQSVDLLHRVKGVISR